MSEEITINKKVAKQMRLFLENALHGFEEYFNVQIEIGNINYTDNHASIKLKANTISKDGKINIKEREDYKHNCRNYGLKPEWLDKEFYGGDGKMFVLIGLNRSAKKYKIIVQNKETGEKYKMSPAQVYKQILSD